MFHDELIAHKQTMQAIESLEETIDKVVDVLAQAIRQKGKVLICGNGGSAADAQHFAAEVVGRFKRERRAWPAIALTTDTSILTAVGNDYGYDDIFARQVEGLAGDGDVLIGISTSGNSANIEKGVQSAKTHNLKTVGLLGKDGGILAKEMDCPIIVPAEDTPRIQEAHIFILHYMAGRLEEALLEEDA